MQAWDGEDMVERVSYTYDLYDRVVREEQDASHYTTYAYDHMNRTKRTDVHSVVNGQAVMVPTDTVYDKNNRVFQQVQDGKEINYLYHATGELAEIQYGDGDGSAWCCTRTTMQDGPRGKDVAGYV